ncbi:cyclic pyranopterin monophosphate synthase MoaC [Methanospirillum hungatei]|jgi:cyclic pyranopterin phosphate synthase|uniref:cyclic pyranopterin monophosphate synthase MoaC n=1 Tax=Methanospirillum hungatei TaxID=2203 RepID=UPI0009D4C40A|nr:cyclic pyranopterin monophosphate synthase MoaC [Methanospirillum hungatei]MBP7034860.1 cyclic pyranopterin monophosphate synthase MoaC [Methanospirillum sp.]MBP9008841.1 cyclic pyranopterin monophosphate synthase MoaC [Methanospirillum sp.]OQA56203.1 MAG: putative cyclic pyranopterin monophosphate synthase accessory protein [Euryarchaeota archaeon ADurb.Bin294]HOW05731.1 cyclic pyranopterin monophosphate synthase MoaC [Methanospirillum hungatei]
MPVFTHLENDRARMVDVSAKGEVYRKAVATGTITLRPDTLSAIRDGTVVKGNVLATARVAATLAIKDTPRLIPMCHAIPVHGIDITFDYTKTGITATVTVISAGKTGVEMEALVGVSTALLTIWDMVKSAEKDEKGQYPVTGISDIRVLEKVKQDL